jgi:hypothetical protein
MKMKQHMAQHIDEHRKVMFRESTNEVKRHLNEMCSRIEEEMSNKADEVFILMRRDYMTVIMGAQVLEGDHPSKAEDLARSEIVWIVQEVERRAENGEGYEEGNGRARGIGWMEGQSPMDVKEDIKDEFMGGVGQDPDEHIKSEDEKATMHERFVKPEPMVE